MKLWLRVLLHGRIEKDKGDYAGMAIKRVTTVEDLGRLSEKGRLRTMFIRDQQKREWRPAMAISTAQYQKLGGKWWQRVYRLPLGYSIYVPAPTK